MVYAGDRGACRLDALLYVRRRGGATPTKQYACAQCTVRAQRGKIITGTTPLRNSFASTQCMCVCARAHGACLPLCTSTLLHRHCNENCLLHA